MSGADRVIDKVKKWIGRLVVLSRSGADVDLIEENGKSQKSKKRLIVGLGNPGRRYAGNRHNIGFMVVDRLAGKYSLSVSRRKHKAFIGTGDIDGNPVILAKPQTYMNRSGDSVVRLADYFNIADADILVVYDEIDLPLGMLRLREQGGSGGHNGMKSVIGQIGQDFPRMRLGVGRPPGKEDPSTYVLRDFDTAELSLVDEVIEMAVAAAEMILSNGLEMAMTHCNGEVRSNR
jgi:PTH1 family peptidyl-tRNA hydrolase